MVPDEPRRRRVGRAGREPAAVRLARLEELEVVVEKLVAGGDGFARFEGIPIFVPRSAPGDRLRVRLTERRPDYGRAEVVEVLEPGAGRRSPPCPHFEECGGCDLQHLEDRRQVELKAAAVCETLERLGGVELPSAFAVVAGEPWGYRLRTQLHPERRGEEVVVGYHRRNSRELVAVGECPILAPDLETLVRELPGRLGDEPPRRLDLLVGDDGRLSVAPVVEGLPHGEVPLTVAGRTYRLDARCFFQAHRTLSGELVERAVGGWEGEAAVDLYAGVGLFSLALAERYRRVIAVEGDRVAARYARINARRHRLDHLEVRGLAVESWIRELAEGVDRVVVDPPRTGLSRPVREGLLSRPPARLTYVSCHAATLARDLRALAGGFGLESLTLLDLFPQTGHMEVVAQLVEQSG